MFPDLTDSCSWGFLGFSFQVNFSEPVVGFTHDDVVVVNGFALDSVMLDTEAMWFDFEVRADPTFFGAL